MIKAILAHACAGPKDQDKHAYGVDDVDRGTRIQRPKTSTPTAWMTSTAGDSDPKAEDKHAYGVDDVEGLGPDLTLRTRS